MTSKLTIATLGDSALLVQFGDEIDITINRYVHGLAALINLSPLEGVIETVPAYATLLVHYDPLILTSARVSDWVRLKIEQLNAAQVRKPRQFDVPVRYGDEYGIDLQFVADSHKLRVEDVIRLHAEKVYTIYMMGFTPGFPYMGTVDRAIMTPRLETPRPRVPAGTVAIAGLQTGIYPIDSPGGWRLIGHTSLRLFDPASEAPFLFAPGDEVRFVVET